MRGGDLKCHPSGNKPLDGLLMFSVLIFLLKLAYDDCLFLRHLDSLGAYVWSESTKYWPNGR